MVPEKILGDIITHAAGKLSEALADRVHPLSKSGKKARELVENGRKLAIDGKLDQALSCFSEASRADPFYVRPQILLVKAHKRKGHRLQALVMCGMALSVASDPESKCELHSYAGTICTEYFEKTGDVLELEQALDHFGEAAAANEGDALCRWNVLSASLLGRKVEPRPFKWSEADAESRAKDALRDLLHVCTRADSNAWQYIERISEMAEIDFPEEDWWRAQCEELKVLASKLTWRGKAGESDRPSGRNRLKLILSTIMLALAGTAYAAFVPVDTSPAQDDPTAPADVAPDDAGGGTEDQAYLDLRLINVESDGRISTPEAAPVETAKANVLEHDWKGTSVLEHDWGPIRLQG